MVLLLWQCYDRLPFRYSYAMHGSEMCKVDVLPCTNLHLIHLNPKSVLTKLDEIIVLAIKTKTAVISVSET